MSRYVLGYVGPPRPPPAWVGVNAALLMWMYVVLLHQFSFTNIFPPCVSPFFIAFAVCLMLPLHQLEFSCVDSSKKEENSTALDGV